VRDIEKNNENLLKASLQGEIKSIIYFDTTTGWTAARADVQGEKQLVVVVGAILQPKVGDILDLEGEWVNHPKYGKQFKFDTYTPVYPDTLNGVTAYLGSGLIKGIGPELAKRIVKIFGKDTFDVIDNKPGLLRKVPGIAEKRIDIISWDEKIAMKLNTKDLADFLTA
jgi:exodeoxyribonuclease V alpha subunit